MRKVLKALSKKRVYVPILCGLLIGTMVAVYLPFRVGMDTEGYISISNSVVLANPGWVSPTSHTANGWADPTYAYDDETTLYASYNVQAVWSPYLELYVSAIDCDKVQAYCSIQNTQVDQMEVDVYYSGAWHNIYSGSPQVDAYYEYAIGSTQSVTGMRFRFNSSKTARWAGVNDADFWEVETTPDITNSPSTWTLNGLTGNSKILTDTIYYANPNSDTTPPSSTVVDGECNFTLTNSSTINIDLFVNCTDFSGGDANMTNSDNGANGATSYGGYSWYSGMLYSNKVIMKTTGSSVLKSALTPAEATLKWGAEIETQTNEWAGGTSSTATMTISAQAS